VELGPLTGSPRDINAEIADVNDNGLWSTNLAGGLTPHGVINQVYFSRNGGTPPAYDVPPDSEDAGEGKWSTVQVPGLPPGINSSPAAERAYFTAFFSSRSTQNYSIYTVTNLQSQMQAPYTPSRMRVQRLSWQANDPLVHYLASDLNDLADDTNSQYIVDWPVNLGILNTRYEPWGNYGNASTPDDPKTASAKNMWLKDPQVNSSARWDFPTNNFPTVGWLGRVHRGTPWQTVYLKAVNIIKTSSGTTSGTNIWQNWTGDFNAADAINEAPVQDRLLFDIFTTAINDNASRGRLSVNVDANTNDPAAGLAAWSAVFSGVVVPTNTVGGYTIIQPAGVAGIGSLLGQIVTNINYERTFFTNATSPVGAFKHVGDILSVRALTEQSPFLTPFLNSALTNQMTDELYEWLPQQTLSLLRADADPRYVIYCYGQTLKPAPNGVVISGGQNYFGMVTNYQVVAETATRAVVQFHPVVATNSVTRLIQTNYSATLEQFNPLPPD
jgi:hypothetical protein